MFDEIVMRGKVAKYLVEVKKISPLQAPVEMEKCIQSITLWTSRFCKDKAHGDAVLNAALEALLV
jgi:hypothetical protein